MVSWCRDGCCHQQFASPLRRYTGRYQILVKHQVDITHAVSPQGRAQPRNQTATNYSVPQPQNLTGAGGLREVQNQARLGYTVSCLQPSTLKAGLDPLPSLYSRCQDCPETWDSKEDPNRRRLTLQRPSSSSVPAIYRKIWGSIGCFIHSFGEQGFSGWLRHTGKLVKTAD